MATADVLYSDSLVEITQGAICFKSYYFPFGSRRVSFSDISHITTEKPSLLNGQYKLHGTGDFVTWFPRDWKRPQRAVIFFAQMRGAARRIGFTVEDAGQVERLLQDARLLARPPAAGKP